MASENQSTAVGRVWALVVKETRQILRDPSSIILGIVMPVMLIVLFGYALSLDVKSVPVAFVWRTAPPKRARASPPGFQLSHLFRGAGAASPCADAGQADAGVAMNVEGIIRIPADFARDATPRAPARPR